MSRKKVLIAVGTRPEAIKMASVYLRLKESQLLDVYLCATSQHRELLKQVLDLFEIQPDFDLDIMKDKQDLSYISESVLHKMKPLLEDLKPDLMLVHGDTTTSSMAALAAFYAQVKVGHVEAGLRTGNKLSPWPEEMNRLLTGRLADIHFAPTDMAQQNLLREAVPQDTVKVTGNTVIDSLKVIVDKIESDTSLQSELEKRYSFLNPEKKLILITAHRRENFGEPFKSICRGLKKTAESLKDDCELIYPVHPNPNVKGPVETIIENAQLNNFHTIAPVDYLDFCYLMNRSHFVITDSGGIQEEAPSLGKPVLVMRENTERPEAVNAGTARLIGSNEDRIFTSAKELLTDQKIYKKFSEAHNPYGDGTAAIQIRKTIESEFSL